MTNQASFQALYIYIHISHSFCNNSWRWILLLSHFAGEKLSHRALKEIVQSDMISRRQIWVMNPGNMALDVILLTTKVGCLHSPLSLLQMVLCVLHSQLY